MIVPNDATLCTAGCPGRGCSTCGGLGWYVTDRARARRERLRLAERFELVCEEHPSLPWPHGDCAGPGMLREDVGS